jgi:hypothetical protein
MLSGSLKKKRRRKMKGRRPFNVGVATAILTLVGPLGCGLLPTPGAEPEIEFLAREESIERGECTYLEWEVQGADDYPVFLDAERVGSSGNERVCPEETTVYELVVGAPGGPYEERVVVQVRSAPGPAPTSAPPLPAATTAPAPAAATATPRPPAPPAATATPRPPAPPAATSTPPAPTPAPTQNPPPPTNTPQIGGITLDGITFDVTLLVGVETAGINSHQPGEWCPNGSFLVGLDLDRQGAYDPLDSPVVGQAECAGTPWRWGPCSWVGVERAGINSHQALPWCPEGQYIVSLDLDRGPAGIDALDSPVVGQARCCPRAPAASSHWAECSWVGVQRAGINSHQPHMWCPAGSLLAGMDLDRGPYDPLDSPVVGQAYCCAPQQP